MTTARRSTIGSLLQKVPRAIRTRLSLQEDKASDAEIDQSLRAGVDMRGTNLWVLMFAVFIASIGLNVNSTAVIIGAMLISPLMGPIMGIGYGVGIDDFTLIRRALKNLAIAAALSLTTSTIYFALSPLTVVQSELLARTTPTIWDVLIALFGGLAGIVGATRKDKSNVIPGVAIATALMPPLCTAGFGAANGNWHFCLNAMYLFTINCVFIALSSAVVIKAFDLPRKQYVEPFVAIRVHRWLGAIVLATVLPSLYLAYELVTEEVFRSRAAQFVRHEINFPEAHVADLSIEPKSKRIEVTLVGQVVTADDLKAVQDRLAPQGLTGTELRFFQTGQGNVDVAALKSNLLGDIYRGGEQALSDRDKTIDALRAQIDAMKSGQERFRDVPMELKAIYPQVESVLLAAGPQWSAHDGWSKSDTITASLRTPAGLGTADRAKILQWLKVRLKATDVKLSVERPKA